MVRVSERPACTSALDPPFAFVAMLQLPVASAHTGLGLAVLPKTSTQRHHDHSTSACLSAKGVYVTRSTILDCPLGAHAAFSAAAAAAWLVERIIVAEVTCAVFRRSKTGCATILTLLRHATPAVRPN
eukprot:2237202-Pleurochrysis_carterae.AAC.1